VRNRPAGVNDRVAFPLNSFMPSISKRGNRYLRVLFVQAAWVVLIKPKSWDRHGLKPWLEAAKKRLHHNVLAIALANKLARIA
jgi:transposase